MRFETPPEKERLGPEKHLAAEVERYREAAALRAKRAEAKKARGPGRRRRPDKPTKRGEIT